MTRILRDKHFMYPLLCWVLVVAWYSLGTLGVFGPVSSRVKDEFNKVTAIFTARPAITKDIVIVAVDNDTLAKVGLKWPWPRSTHADIFKGIIAQSPRAVAFDFVFNGPSSDPAADAAFAEALGLFPRTILAYSIPEDGGQLQPYRLFFEKVAGTGFVNKPRDRDDVIRSARLFVSDGTWIDYSLEIKLAAVCLGVPLDKIGVRDGRVHLGDMKSMAVHSNGMVRINWRLFPDDVTVVPAYRVLDGTVPAGAFKDKIVFIGATARIVHDEDSSPFGIIPGVMMLANTLAMIMSGYFIMIMPVWADFLIIGMLGIFIIWSNRRFTFMQGSVITAVVMGIWLALMLALRSRGVEFDYFRHLFLIMSAYIIYTVYKYCHVLYLSNKLKNLAVTDALTHFYTSRYFTLLVDQRLRTQEKNISLVSIAVREYRSLSRKYDFEDMKSFTRAFAQFIENQYKEKIPAAVFARSLEGKFFVLTSRYPRASLTALTQSIVKKISETGFSFGQEAEHISVAASVVYSSSHESLSGRRLFYFAEKTIAETIKNTPDDIRCIDVHETLWDAHKADDQQDELEFLSVDLEERNNDLEEALKRAEEVQRDVEKAYFDVVMTLVKALEEKDTFTQGHSDRTAKYAVAIAREAGWSEEDRQRLYKAALLHDIGKIGIPETLLHKKEALTDDDFNFIKRHPVMSVEILKPIKAFETLLPMILHHHERYDGTGYPYGLSGDMIPDGAQILAVADCFDAITCGRGYKKGTSLREGLGELQKWSGKQFNPRYIEAFQRVLKL